MYQFSRWKEIVHIWGLYRSDLTLHFWSMFQCHVTLPSGRNRSKTEGPYYLKVEKDVNLFSTMLVSVWVDLSKK